MARVLNNQCDVEVTVERYERMPAASLTQSVRVGAVRGVYECQVRCQGGTGRLGASSTLQGCPRNHCSWRRRTIATAISI